MVDQLIEQEKLFQQDLLLMERGKKEEVGQAFQASMPWKIADRSPGETWVSA
ncbi:hypothetical protein KSD_76900 [Ktedonobacter sp. SOSP1-85]|uniref:hypothetical protein n=1 Tax=Ktedonobacter sp. SOSP1-85 TaxID=2778367 RepID=UPI001915F1F5|nr:hypothetical protein [Ktedonobacter sp. SOSP1-85]GHO79919.1 hypothetical protein KSD_76900 [Ktedonobacter sp. SOSP1-85]